MIINNCLVFYINVLISIKFRKQPFQVSSSLSSSQNRDKGRENGQNSEIGEDLEKYFIQIEGSEAKN